MSLPTLPLLEPPSSPSLTSATPPNPPSMLPTAPDACLFPLSSPSSPHITSPPPPLPLSIPPILNSPVTPLAQKVSSDKQPYKGALHQSSHLIDLKRKQEEAAIKELAQKCLNLSKALVPNLAEQDNGKGGDVDTNDNVDKGTKVSKGANISKLARTIHSLQLATNRESISARPIHLYSVDQIQYFVYEGKHFSAEIADDLDALASHINSLREEYGLPLGGHPEWGAGLSSPIALSPPLICSTYLESFPIFMTQFSTLYNNTKYDPDKPSAVFIEASYWDFFEMSKSINSLDNLLCGGVPAPTQLATDLCAAAPQYKDFPVELPVQVMNWCLLAKVNVVHAAHTNQPGTCTWVAIEDGLKKWDVGFPPGSKAEAKAAMPSVYRKWQWLSLLLTPGSMLIMCPGIVDSITTLQDCMALGGHFFSMPTIKYSVYSIFHMFVGSYMVTNVPFNSKQQMLLQIVLLWHKSLIATSNILS
ncbi:hypothetical protein GYMLUDRAFT_63462 [Collybiopsis luxurians FD-317 M1]|uniref:Unplaced genomic scaffold GYMLUscaffold_74, whole genome shotgun sequence n=1 Tax=Collybiopsis luxurians FD-317 M1 TaxID=944289 RepID=A0A0D0BW58_9AGAR|nr:hypothetical protein GYMLUDRAFT_63462 [Collybiopsis luxurians FD-317 M1]